MRNLFAILALIGLCACASTEPVVQRAALSVPAVVEMARVSYIAHANSCLCVKQSEYNKTIAVWAQYRSAAKSLSDAAAEYGTNTVPDNAVLTALEGIAENTASQFIALVLPQLPTDEAAKVKSVAPKSIVIK